MLRNDVTEDSESLSYAATLVTRGNDFEWDYIADGHMNYAENIGNTTYPCGSSLSTTE